MVQAIRVEHPASGNGIWHHEDSEYGYWGVLFYGPLDSLRQRHAGFPSPIFEEKLKTIDESEFCAFRSIEQIQQWIMPEEFATLAQYGFKVYLLELTEAREGDFQVVFRKESIIEKKDISQLFLAAQ